MNIATLLVVLLRCPRLVAVGLFPLHLYGLGANLSGEVVLVWVQVLWWRYQPHRMLKGGGQAPVGRPPGCSGGIRWSRGCGARSADLEELKGIDDVQDVSEDDEGNADCGRVGRVPTLVFNIHPKVGKNRGQRAQAVPGDVCVSRDDVEREDNLLDDDQRDNNRHDCKEGAGFGKMVTHLVVAPGMHQVHVCQKDAETRVDIIGPPLVLDLPISLKVLRRRASRVVGHHRLHHVPVVHVLLLAVPRGHIVAVPGTGLGVRLDLDALVEAALTSSSRTLVPRPGKPQQLTHGHLLVVGHELPCPVEHRHAWDRQPYKARQHVSARGVCAERCVHRQPHRHAEVHVAAGEVCEEKSHAPAWWRRGVEAQTTWTEERGENGQ
mmetsp:Transcript_23543/g.52111  ORF Transcript_23543/g.52111 Transcript_23543/m.52111 type:complete len:379 (-) Transcript_23543:386-1522(-)